MYQFLFHGAIISILAAVINIHLYFWFFSMLQLRSSLPLSLVIYTPIYVMFMAFLCCCHIFAILFHHYAFMFPSCK